MTAKELEKQRIKERLMQPLPERGKVIMSMGQSAQQKEDADDKFKKQMAWGTPRLVTKNKNLIMDENQLKQRSYLLNIAAERKGVSNAQAEEQKSDFKAVSINNFRKNMLLEEKMELQKESGGAGE